MNNWLFLARQTWKYFGNLSRRNENYVFLCTKILFKEVFLPWTEVKVVFLLNCRIFQVFWTSLCTKLYVFLIEATILMKQTSKKYLTSYEAEFSFKHLTRTLPTKHNKTLTLGHSHISSNSPNGLFKRSSVLNWGFSNNHLLSQAINRHDLVKDLQHSGGW